MTRDEATAARGRFGAFQIATPRLADWLLLGNSYGR